jgi:hypothetical protein
METAARRRLLPFFLAPLFLAGCAESSSALHGVTTAGIAAALGSAGGPVVGFLAGIGAGYAVDQGVKYGEREMQANAQQAIADTAGPLEEGKGATWEVTDATPFFGRSGTVQVARAFGEAIPCKDAVFTVGDKPELFVTTICRDRSDRWRWAIAEPTVQRWGALQ